MFHCLHLQCLTTHQLQEQAEHFVVSIESEKRAIDTVAEQTGLMKHKILHQRKMMGGVNAAKENEYMVQKQVRARVRENGTRYIMRSANLCTVDAHAVHKINLPSYAEQKSNFRREKNTLSARKDAAVRTPTYFCGRDLKKIPFSPYRRFGFWKTAWTRLSPSSTKPSLTTRLCAKRSVSHKSAVPT